MRSISIVVGATLLLAGSYGESRAAPPTKEEQRRRDLLDKVGLKKAPDKSSPAPDTPLAPPAEDNDEAYPDEGASEAPPRETEPSPEGPDKPSSPNSNKPKPRRPTYRGQVHAVVERSCSGCHSASGSARRSDYVVSGDIEADYRAALRHVDRSKPDASAFVAKAIGTRHGGGATIAASSSAHRLLVDWIAAGAPLGSERARAESPVPAPTAVPPTTTAPVSPNVDKSAKTPPVRRDGPASSPTGGTAKPVDAESPATDAGPKEVTPTDAHLSETTALATAPVVAYVSAVHNTLASGCASCHAAGASASSSGYVITYDPVRDYVTTKRFTDTKQPSASKLLSKARGEAHGGGAAWSAESPEYELVLAWISGGAVEQAPVGEAAVTATGEPTTEGATGAPPAAAHPNMPPGHPPAGGVALPLDFRLNGKFDVSYERNNYEDNPFGDGTNTIESYHHFLILTRNPPRDPFGVNVELLTQQFYEFSARLGDPAAAYQFSFRAGKIMVPFGADPTFHHSYGGRSGFDQQILPVVWSRHGAAARFDWRRDSVSVFNELYAVHGYALTQADQVINLARDFSTVDNARFGFGDRLGGAIGPVRLWYSVYGNGLGVDRRLFMQAFDAQLSRPTDLPVLRDVVASVGLFRADITGGPAADRAGSDYYHFGSYWALRYYPISPLYVEYRNGLRTTDNRRGLFFDDTRVDDLDRSSHNLTLAGRYRGFYARFQIFWNLEKANEQRDDRLRFTVGYEF